MDDSSTGLRLIISDLTDTLCGTDRVLSRVFLLKIRRWKLLERITGQLTIKE